MSIISGILNTPQTSIGAQELLAVGRCTKFGFLRKQGRLERLFKFMKWRQRFVALSRGCIYIFEDELASSPKASFSLKLFIKCERHPAGDTIWPFRVFSSRGESGKSLLFSCMSDPDRKIWMQHLKQEMMLAHQLPQSIIDAEDGNYDDYVYLEKPIPRKQPPQPPSPQKDDEDPGGENDYNTIDEEMISEIMKDRHGSIKRNSIPKKPKTLPPNANKKVKNESKKSATFPQPSMTGVSRKAFEYDGSDRTEIERLLVARPEGTYLVRKSRSDGKEVLSVNIDGCLKEFKIYLKDDLVTINNEDYFNSVESMIQNYRDVPLPKKSTKLLLAYSVTDPRYKNQV